MFQLYLSALVVAAKSLKKRRVGACFLPGESREWEMFANIITWSFGVRLGSGKKTSV
jgi:hypothetical protein